jgi:hypothetical protein
MKNKTSIAAAILLLAATLPLTPQRGNIDYDQIRSAARKGNGTQFQMFGGGSTTSGHAAVYDSNGNVIDNGAPGSGCGTGGVLAKTGNYTLASGDIGELVTFNGSSLTATLPNPAPAQWCASIENINSTDLTISRNSLQINGGTSNITLKQYDVITVWSDSSNYFASTPLVAGSGITLTPASTGKTVAAAGGGGLSVSAGYLTDGVNFYVGFPFVQVTQPPAIGGFTALNMTGATFSNIASGSAIFMRSTTSVATQMEYLSLSAPITRTLTVLPAIPINGGDVGGIAYTDATKALLCSYANVNSSNIFVIQAFTQNNVTNTALTLVGTTTQLNLPMGNLLSLRLADSGGNITCQYSLDNFASSSTVYTVGDTVFFGAQPTKIGPFVYANAVVPMSMTIVGWQ